MPVIFHKFRELEIRKDVEILILGIYSPDVPEEPDFFYGRSRNYLWHLLPICWGLESLKDASLAKKLEFAKSQKIGFADLVDALDVSEGEEGNTDDAFIDGHVHQWNNLTVLIDSLPGLKAVYFTRKTFNGIPNMKREVISIAKHCQEKGIRMCKLDPPSRHFSVEKQQQWIDTIILQKTCLRVS